MLARLIYASKANAFRAADLADILEVSRTDNPKAGITGALGLLDGVYLQYLEGDDAALEALYAKIQVDRRHREPVVLERTFIAVRAFPEWSMALLRWDERIRAVAQRHGLGPSQSPYDIAPNVVAPFFRALAATPNWMAL
jgi:hypothetical protein